MTITGAQFRDQMQRECIDALKRHGFIEFRKGWAIKPINDDFRCWTGLNFGVYGGYVSLNPFIGVHSERIERLVSEISGDHAPKYDNRTATYAVHMGEIAPNEQEFCFYYGDDLPSEAERLAELYAHVGFSFSRSISSNAALLPLLWERTPMLGGFPERYAVCLYQLGRRGEAADYIRQLADEEEHIRPFCTNFLEFCRATAS